MWLMVCDFASYMKIVMHDLCVCICMYMDWSEGKGGDDVWSRANEELTFCICVCDLALY